MLVDSGIPEGTVACCFLSTELIAVPGLDVSKALISYELNHKPNDTSARELKAKCMKAEWLNILVAIV
jgi:hypothetical protein